MPYRPPLKLQKTKRIVASTAPTSVFDLAKGFNQISVLVQELEALKLEYQKSIEEIQDSTVISSREVYNNLTKTFAKEFNKILERANEALSSIKKGDKGDSYVLTDYDKKTIASLVEVKPNIVEKIIEKREVVVEKPSITQIVSSEKESAVQIAEKLNTTDGTIEQKVIKDLEKTLKNLEQELRYLASKIAIGGGSGASGGGGGSWHQTALVGVIDGNNTVYTFAGVKPSQYSERVFLNYTEQNPVNGDYTINYETQTVTYATAPSALLSGTPHIIRYHA